MKKIDMTKGRILRILISIAIPLVLSNLMNMAYNFTDMYWVGKVGTESLSALGTAGLYIWLSAGVIMVSKIGTEIYLAQAVGRKDDLEIKAYAINGIKLGFLIAFIYTFIVVVFRDQLINIFDLELVTAGFAKEYLIFGGIAIFFMMMNQLYMSVFQSLGNTKIIFIYISIGLVANMILDPLFILTFDMGVSGAAIATLIGSFLPFVLFTITLKRKTNIFDDFKFKLDGKITKKVSRISTPVAFQNCIFTLIAMFISMLVVKYGNEAIAAQRIGNQLESFSWMISLAISASIGAFVGQNYGAKNFQRISRGTFLICILMSIYGLIVTYIFLFKSENLFSIFSNDLGVLEIGYSYLLIVAFSQIFIIYEGIASGVFNAIGLTRIPVFFSLTGNVARIPLGILFSSLYGIDGIWFALSLTAIYKGMGVFIALIIYFIKNKDYKLKYFFTRI